jgi:hypothetical protein
MAYFLAPSLVQLRNEVNAAHPNRSKASDGWVGDTAHAARKSDHNPDYSAGGIVRALDVTHAGIDKAKLLRVACANPSTEYVIQDWKIYTRSNGFRAAKYTGSNGHTVHTHISIRHTAAAAAAKAWGYSGGGAAPAPAPSPGQGGLSVYEAARQVIAGRFGTGTDRQNRLRAAGYDPAAVQAEVNRILKGGGPPAPPAGQASVAEVARQVIAGKWGNGNDRINRLKAAGYNYDAVRAEVNRILSGGAPAPAPAPSKSVNQLAREVIAGQWGNGPARSQRLAAAGFNPTAVQAEVNRILGGGGGGAARLSIGVLAQQVIAGQWGNGAERERRITAAGYDYQAVRAEVNRRV